MPNGEVTVASQGLVSGIEGVSGAPLNRRYERGVLSILKPTCNRIASLNRSIPGGGPFNSEAFGVPNGEVTVACPALVAAMFGVSGTTRNRSYEWGEPFNSEGNLQPNCTPESQK